jgi:hypothetical protein
MLPLVSIIIPCGGSHHKYVGVAVASCLWQSYTNIEVVVVDDGPVELPRYADPRVVTIKSPNYGKANPVGNRPAVARNAGLAVSHGAFVVFLDADDYLLPQAIELLIRGHASHDKSYTYSSHYAGTRHQRPPDYNQAKYKEFNLHPITALVPRAYAIEVGGFDESAPGWEDWTFYLRLAIAGYCGRYYRGPIFVYRVENSIVHHADIAGGQELMDKVIASYKNEKGDITMGCCGSTPKTALKAAITSMGEIPMVNGMQTLEYTGTQSGSFIIKHPVSKRIYKSGSNPSVRFITVPPEDVAYLLQMSFRVVMPESPLQPPPAPAEVAEIIEPTVVYAQVIEPQPETKISESIDEKPRRLGRPKKQE